MTYLVTIKQDSPYMDTLVGAFDDLAQAQEYIELTIRYFDNVKVQIEGLKDEQEDANA